MRAFIIALVLSASVTIFVGVNSFALSYNIEKVHAMIDTAPNDVEADDLYKSIYEEYKRRSFYIALTVSHNELAQISSNFAELLGALEADDDDGLIIAKSHLKNSLELLKRLSSINFDSIF